MASRRPPPSARCLDSGPANGLAEALMALVTAENHEVGSDEVAPFEACSTNEEEEDEEEADDDCGAAKEPLVAAPGDVLVAEAAEA